MYAYGDQALTAVEHPLLDYCQIIAVMYGTVVRNTSLDTAAGMGTGLAFLNNLGQLVIALGGESNGQAVFVSLFSVSSCAGRLLLG